MRPLTAAALIVLCEGLTFGAILPVMHTYCQSFGGGALALGFLFALVSGPKIFMNPVFGRLSDRIGRRPVLMLTTFGTLAGSVLWAIAPNVLWLAVSRGVTGVFGAQAALASAVAADVTVPARRAASMGVLGAAFGLSITLGPLLGGAVGAGLSNAAVGWACALLQVISLAIIAFGLRETRAIGSDKAAGDTGSGGWRTMLWLRSGPVARLMAVTLLLWLGFSAMNGTYQLVTQRVYGFNERHTSYAFAVLGITGALVQGGAIRRLSTAFGERRLVLAGAALLIAAFVSIAIRPPLWGFWCATLLIAIGSALVVPCLAGLVSRSVSETEQGAVLGLHQGVIGLGRAGGAALGGGLFALGGPALTYAPAAAVLAASAALLIPLRPPPTSH